MVCYLLNVHQFRKLKSTKAKEAGSLVQLWHFILHLRWHYQLFILSGGFLLGGFLSTEFNIRSFLFQFCNVHLLLFGGATAYNSYWDKDKGPIGGLKNPPLMSPWMWLGALLFQMVGLMWAIPQGSLYVSIFALSMLFFWLYSTPLVRWKSRPVKSLIAIGVSTGFNAVLLGYLAAGNWRIDVPILIAAVGVTFILLSLYPISQIYQKDEDLRRGDQTFTLQYGKSGVNFFFDSAFFTGLILVTATIAYSHLWLSLFFGLLGIITGFWIRPKLQALTAKKEDYATVMRIKYSTSISFVLFLLVALILKHIPIDGISPAVDLLLK